MGLAHPHPHVPPSHATSAPVGAVGGSMVGSFGMGGVNLSQLGLGSLTRQLSAHTHTHKMPGMRTARDPAVGKVIELLVDGVEVRAVVALCTSNHVFYDAQAEDTAQKHAEAQAGATPGVGAGAGIGIPLLPPNPPSGGKKCRSGFGTRTKEGDHFKRHRTVKIGPGGRGSWTLHAGALEKKPMVASGPSSQRRFLAGQWLRAPDLKNNSVISGVLRRETKEVLPWTHGVDDAMVLLFYPKTNQFRPVAFGAITGLTFGWITREEVSASPGSTSASPRPCLASPRLASPRLI